MQPKRFDIFTTVRTEGALLPPDLLARIAEGAPGMEGLRPEDYHLAGEKLNEAINRAWNRARGLWAAFTAARAKLPETDAGTTLTRERWLLPLLAELGYGRLQTARPVEIDGRAYPASHAWGHVPIHLIAFRAPLDHRAPGAARGIPHSMMQELLNRSAGHLWGFLSNGLRFRVLRDNASLARQAYVEFDLEAMMEGEIYADFVLFWLVCHQSRVESETPAACWLERWARAAAEGGTRALEGLRTGVERAIAALGAGFIAHPANAALRERLRTGALPREDYYRQLLRSVYAMLLLFVAEDRDLLHPEGTPESARERYARWYSTARLRRLAARRRGGRHTDLYTLLRLVCNLVGGGGNIEGRENAAALGLPVLGGFLFAPGAVPDLETARLANDALLEAVRGLAWTADRSGARPVDYRNLGSEELGSIYESLLELHPEMNLEAGTFALATGGGNERKTTGSHYTPTELITPLLDSALEPALARAAAAPDPEAAILDLRICDSACGSGHFLAAAARRIARRLAAVRSGEEEPAPEGVGHALREVIGRCIYGVDLNPMAVELCKVALWMEALEPGRPLSFLDHHIRCGNSLLGATPALIARGLPDAAFEPIEGDERGCCAEYKRNNARERKTGQSTGFTRGGEPWHNVGNLGAAMLGIDRLPDDTPEGVRAKEARYAEHLASQGYEYNHLLADAWCAAFLWPKTAARAAEGLWPITHEELRRIRENPHAVARHRREEIRRLAEAGRFFHWHLEFPDVFIPLEPERVSADDPNGWAGGFDAVLGNPPWERLKLQEQEWFAVRAPEIAGAPNAAARKRKIDGLADTDPALHAAFLLARRAAEGGSRMARGSGRYPLCGRGDVNTYAVFAELDRHLLAPHGRAGIIVPSGIATDDTTKFFFQDLAERTALHSLFDFQSGPGLFAEIGHARFKFCLLTMLGDEGTCAEAEFAFFLRSAEELLDDDKRFVLTAEDIALVNPNTRTCPIFRSRRDAEITKGVYRRVLVLVREGPPEENPWGVRFGTMFHMANDSGLFHTQQQLQSEGWDLNGNVFERGEERYLPLYEAKMIHQFTHRFGDYRDKPEGSESTALPEVSAERLRNPAYTVLPRYWVPAVAVAEKLNGVWEREWLMGWRNITNATNERTVIAGVLPRVAIGHSTPLFLSRVPIASRAALLYANVSAFSFDYFARQKLGGTNLTFGYMYQFPVLPPESFDVATSWTSGEPVNQWLLPRVVELVYTAHDLAPFARDCGYEGPPFAWDPERRFQLRCELDAAFFHLYGIPREDAEYIMETFPIVKRKDIAAHGTYRTKERILEIFDEMSGVVPVEQPIKRKGPKEASPAFKRAAFAAHILYASREDAKLTAVKYEKLLHLTEYHAQVPGLETNYARKVAGPYDGRFTHSVEQMMAHSKWFRKVVGTGRAHRYVPLENVSSVEGYYNRYWAEYDAAVQHVLDIMRPLDWEKSEAISTLYAVWNDLIIADAPFDDAEIIRGFREDWDVSKKRFTVAELTSALEWMRRKGLVPVGWGKATVRPKEKTARKRKQKK